MEMGGEDPWRRDGTHDAGVEYKMSTKVIGSDASRTSGSVNCALKCAP